MQCHPHCVDCWEKVYCCQQAQCGQSLEANLLAHARMDPYAHQIYVSETHFSVGLVVKQDTGVQNRVIFAILYSFQY